nr:MAG TPA: hypothetical protein [Caudoviricetes sp.]
MVDILRSSATVALTGLYFGSLLKEFLSYN